MSNPSLPIPNSPPLPQTKWPMVIGVICIVFGTLGILSAPMQLVSSAVTKMQLQMYVDGGSVTQEQVDAHIAKWSKVQLLVGCFMGIVSIFMLIGGILLVKRKKKGALFIKIWSALFIVYAFSTPFFMGDMMADQMALQFAAEVEGELDMEQFQSIMGIIMKVAMFVGVLFSLALPIFFLIWFGRAKIKSEMRAWPG